jgi:hypothetical protein
VPVNDALHRSKAYACPFELARRVQALKGPEQLLGVGHLKPGAVVAHEIHRFVIVVLLSTELYLRARVLLCELPCVVEQVVQGHP